MFAVICAPNFFLQAALRHDLELRSKPVVLIDGALTNPSKTAVLQCTAAAEAAGVCAGLTAPQAMARCPELILKTRSAATEQDASSVLLQTAYSFSPNIEATSAGVCTVDLRGINFCSSRRKAHSILSERSQGLLTSAAAAEELPLQFEGFPSRTPTEDADVEFKQWAEKIRIALASFHLEAQIGIGATPNIALLAARAARPLLVIEQLAKFFAALPIEALEPTPEVLGILRRWGIHTAAAFLALGKDAISERLGTAALELFERASAQSIRPLNIVAPPESFEEQMEFEVEIESLEPLLFVLRRFVEQLTRRIELLYRVVAELRLELRFSAGTKYERVFKVPAPTGNVETLFRMLHTHLETLRTDAPITSLKLSAQPALAQKQQFSLFESTLRDPNHFHETLARLSALVGAERVGTPILEQTHRPDSLRMEVPAFDQPTVHRQSAMAEKQKSVAGKDEFLVRITIGLALRRFRPPFHADVELRDGKPVFVSTLKFTSPVIRARGPWRASGHWWDNRRWLRQEWDVELRDGAVYRLFNANDDWLVEGVYD